jgi:hypothetical protein
VLRDGSWPLFPRSERVPLRLPPALGFRSKSSKGPRSRSPAWGRTCTSGEPSFYVHQGRLPSPTNCSSFLPRLRSPFIFPPSNRQLALHEHLVIYLRMRLLAVSAIQVSEDPFAFTGYRSVLHRAYFCSSLSPPRQTSHPALALDNQHSPPWIHI